MRHGIVDGGPHATHRAVPLQSHLRHTQPPRQSLPKWLSAALILDHLSSRAKFTLASHPSYYSFRIVSTCNHDAHNYIGCEVLQS